MFVARERFRLAADVHQPELIQGLEDHSLPVRRKRRAHNSLDLLRRARIQIELLVAVGRPVQREPSLKRDVARLPVIESCQADLAVARIQNLVAPQPIA